MDFGTNKTPVEIIKEGAFGETYFRDIYYGVNGKWHRNSWKDITVLKKIDQKNYWSSYYDAKYHNKVGKQKAAEYYRQNTESIRLEAKNKYRNLSEMKKNKKRKYQRKRYHMNTDLNERLKHYQRNYHTSKKLKKKKIVFTV